MFGSEANGKGVVWRMKCGLGLCWSVNGSENEMFF